MNYADAIAALASAKASGDVAAIIAAAEAIAAAGEPAKPARKPRKAKAEAGPEWWNDAKTGKRSIRESIAVEFSGSHSIRCNLVTDPGKPLNLAKAVRIAVAFWRAKEGDGQCPEIASVTRLETGETFPADLISELSAAWRAPVVAARIVEADGDKRARLERTLASARALLERRKLDFEASAPCRSWEPLCRAWMRAEGAEREEIERRLSGLDGGHTQAAWDVQSAARHVATLEAAIADIGKPRLPAAERLIEAWSDEDAAALDAEPLEAAYPDAEDEAEPEPEAAPVEAAPAPVAEPEPVAVAPVAVAKRGRGRPRKVRPVECTDAEFTARLERDGRRRAARERLDAVRAWRALPFPDAGKPYRVKPRIRVKCGSRPHVPVAPAPVAEPRPFARLLATIEGEIAANALPAPVAAPQPRVRVPRGLLASGSRIAIARAA